MQKISTKLPSILTNPNFSHGKLSDWKLLTYSVLFLHLCIFWGIHYTPKQQNVHKIFLWSLG